MNRFIRNRLIACLGFLVCASSWAQSLPSNSVHLQVSDNAFEYHIIDANTLRATHRFTMKALTQQGAQELSSTTLSFQEGMQTLALVEAYTLKASGEKIKLGDADLQKQKGQLGGSTGLSYPEQHTWQLKFPNVQLGDSVHAHYVHTQIKPYLPGWHSAFWFENRNFTTDALRITLRAPKAIPWHVAHHGLELSDASSASEQVLQFKTSTQAGSFEQSPMNMSLTVPRLLASTYATPQAVGDGYAVLTYQKLVDLPQIKSLADRLTQGMSEPRQVAQTLADWARKNIRYSAVFLGNGGFEPHDLSDILDKKYGDCKDQTLLLMALLKAKGIAAEPALINTGTDYALFPVGVAAFNHVITYVPSLNLYIDPTASTVPFGEVPWVEKGKPVVLARLAAAGGSVLAKVPNISPGGNSIRTESLFKIDADGNLTGDLSIRTSGQAAMQMQDRLEQIPAGMRSAAVSQMLNAAGLRGKGTLIYDAINRDIPQQDLSGFFEVQEYIKNLDGGTTAPNPHLPGLSAIYPNNHLGNFIAETRSTDMRCTAISVKEVFTVIYDAKFKLLRTPSNFSEKVDTIQFSATYTREGNTVSGVREYIDTNPEPYCTPQQYQRRRLGVSRIRRHLASSVMFEQTAN